MNARATKKRYTKYFKVISRTRKFVVVKYTELEYVKCSSTGID